ncbi:MAG: MarR family transcriptional regulator [Chloroflexi bacterium]|nr:MarR family transcriptional regulator [Chloroflexota bacterium]
MPGVSVELPNSEEIVSLTAEIKRRQFPRLVVFADMVGRYVEARLRDKYSFLEVNLLSFLIVRGGSLTPSKVAQLMLRSKHSMTRLIDNLEAQGFAERQLRVGEDRRYIQIRVTSAGMAYMRRFLDDVDLMEQEVMSRLDENEREVLMALTKKLGRILMGEPANNHWKETPPGNALATSAENDPTSIRSST